MSYTFDSRLGEQLYRLLPEVYRTRDRAGGDSSDNDLARYLDAHGHLLDLIHATLEQQLNDVLPGSSQDWLLPYLAELLAASAVSPHPEGRHAEISNAVPWRQRKGTLRCAEEIAEAVGDAEVEIQEGWQRVAITPRIGMPLLAPEIIDDTLSIDPDVPGQINLHPGLPVATVDLRRYSRAVEALSSNPAARSAAFGGIRQTWRQANVHGVPCFPDSFEDASRRTADLRSESLNASRYHHKKLLAYMPPPTGMFPLDPVPIKWDERRLPLYEHLLEEVEENGVTVIRNRSSRIIQITDAATLDAAPAYRVENLDFLDTLAVANGTRLELHSIEAAQVAVPTFSATDAVLIASDCLFGTLVVGSGPAELDSCTVIGESVLYIVDALDCIFGSVTGSGVKGVLRNSRVPDFAAFSTEQGELETRNTHSDAPVYFPGQSSLAAQAVLAPGTPESITKGALDGGEMGYFHRGRSRGVVRITGDFLGAGKLVIPARGFRLWKIAMVGAAEVAGGPLTFDGSGAASLKVTGDLPGDAEVTQPAIDATDSLFERLEVTKGLARLEYCTVMELADCKYLQASDTLFAGSIEGVKKPPPSNKPGFVNCLRYSALPAALLEGIASSPDSSAAKKLARALRLINLDGEYMPGTNTLASPVFITVHYCNESGHQNRQPAFGEAGYGVLSPHAPDAVRFGAEDGGEMGASHSDYLSLKAEATLDKMTEFLPVGIEPLLLLDSRLWQVPPEIAT